MKAQELNAQEDRKKNTGSFWFAAPTPLESEDCGGGGEGVISLHKSTNVNTFKVDSYCYGSPVIGSSYNVNDSLNSFNDLIVQHFTIFNSSHGNTAEMNSHLQNSSDQSMY